MKLFLFLDITIIFFLSFVIAQKRFHVLITIFNFLVLEILITCYFGMLDINYNLWEVSKNTQLIFILRTYELFLSPLLYVWYFDLLSSIRTLLSKIILTFLLLGVFWGFEVLFVKWRVFSFNDWQYWKALLSYLGILLISYPFQKWFQFILEKEGIELK